MPTLLTRSGSVSTATGVTSDPVPAVVGRATIGQHGAGHPELAVVVGRLAAVREEHGHRLGEVEAAAPAHADDDVRVRAGGELGALGHLVHGDVGQHLGERRHLHPGALEQPDQLGVLARGPEPGVGADQRAGPESGGHRPESVPLPGSEQDLARSAQDGEHAHGGSRRSMVTR